jgi:CheY-like chemotaxis protein
MKKILVVDDVHAIAEATAALLGMFGHEVRTAHDGREAVDAVRDEHPDAVAVSIKSNRAR